MRANVVRIFFFVYSTQKSDANLDMISRKNSIWTRIRKTI
jgi:hypothetical protein